MSDSLRSTQKSLVVLPALSAVAMRSHKAISIHPSRVPGSFFQSLRTRDFPKYAIFQFVLSKLLFFQHVKSASGSQTVFEKGVSGELPQLLLTCTSLKASVTANICTGRESGPLQYNISRGKTYLLVPAQVTSLQKYIINNNQAERPSLYPLMRYCLLPQYLKPSPSHF